MRTKAKETIKSSHSVLQSSEGYIFQSCLRWLTNQASDCESREPWFCLSSCLNSVWDTHQAYLQLWGDTVIQVSACLFFQNIFWVAKHQLLGIIVNVLKSTVRKYSNTYFFFLYNLANAVSLDTSGDWFFFFFFFHYLTVSFECMSLWKLFANGIFFLVTLKKKQNWVNPIKIIFFLY